MKYLCLASVLFCMLSCDTDSYESVYDYEYRVETNVDNSESTYSTLEKTHLFLTKNGDVLFNDTIRFDSGVSGHKKYSVVSLSYAEVDELDLILTASKTNFCISITIKDIENDDALLPGPSNCTEGKVINFHKDGQRSWNMD